MSGDKIDTSALIYLVFNNKIKNYVKTPKQKNDSEFFCYKYAKCKMR